MYLCYLENYRTKEHTTIGLFSSYELALSAQQEASAYWNDDHNYPEWLGTIMEVELDKLPTYLGE